MGYGDEIMAAAEARRLRGSGNRVAILDRAGKRRWHALWEGNPDIARPGEGGKFQTVVNGPGCRPYVDYDRMRAELEEIYPGRPFTTKIRDARLPWRYTDWRCAPAQGIVVVPPTPKAGYIVIEPHLKANASPNKQWGWDRWQDLVTSSPGFEWVQLGPKGTRILEGARHFTTSNFDVACIALSGAAAAVLPEGGLHHAAAALGVRSVVLMGPMVSRVNTAYALHSNIVPYDPESSGCGQRIDCAHCRRWWDGYHAADVVAELEKLIDEQPNN